MLGFTSIFAAPVAPMALANSAQSPAAEATLPLAAPEPRFVFIDALRGIAAMAVVIHHALYSPLIDALRRAVPRTILILCEDGFLGVDVFFVISGFVIAHSLRNIVLHPQSIALFALRRQVRLDPPYWLVLFGSLLLWGMMRALMGSARVDPLPGPGAVALNMTYLQKIARAPEILGVAWTLCIEIQLYLFFSVLLWLGQRGRGTSSLPTRLAILLVFATGAASLALNSNVLHDAWMARYWWLFASGVLCYWTVRRVLSPWVFGIFIALVLVSRVQHASNLPLYTGTASSVVICTVGKMGRLTTLLGGPTLQYLGRTSYCLYLVHWPVKIVVLGLGFALTRQNSLAAIAWCLLYIAVSIAVAHVLHVLVERPCIRWSSSLKRIRTFRHDISLMAVPTGAAGS